MKEDAQENQAKEVEGVGLNEEKMQEAAKVSEKEEEKKDLP